VAQLESTAEALPAAESNGRPWIAHAGVAVILLTLGTLIVAPALIQRRISVLRGEVARSDAARAEVGVVEFELALQMSGLRGYLLSGDTSFLRAYDTSQRRESEAFAQLDRVLAPSPRPLRDALARLRYAAARWERDADDEEIVRRRRVMVPAQISTEQAQFERALRGASALDQALRRDADAARAAIRDADQLRFVITGGLVVLALASALAATWFSRRIGVLARVAAGRRDQAEAALGELRASDLARARMLRGVTHDLKNPLGAALGYAELLDDDAVSGALSPVQRGMVAAIRRNLNGSLAILHDLLDLSQAERGALALESGPTDCAALLREAVEEYRGMAGITGHRLEVADGAGECAAVTAWTDPRRVRQILGNLLSNGLKYSPEGTRVRAGAEALGGEGNILLWVEDEGPGVPPADRERVFDEFQRLNPAQVHGHGLGLAISRRVARLLGGELWVEEGELGGARFTLRLPAEAPPRD
jgi:signal transduction histidine kinase